MKRNLFEQAKACIAGGVNSPVRAFKGLGIEPLFIKSGKGKQIVSEENKRYVDFCLSWGPLILGHAHPLVVKDAVKQIKKGSTFGAPTVLETRLAELICSMVPSIEILRFVSSGTEAVMSAIRLARGVSGKEIIVKMDGCYHGHSDSLLVNAGSGLAGKTSSGSAGVPEALTRLTISIPYNDPEILGSLLRSKAGKIAAVILEPVPGNMGLVLPKPGYLEKVRELTANHGVLLIFDEVITGFRAGPCGVQDLFGVRPDITILGKIIGGGYPAGAFGASKSIMSHLAPEGNVYQAGTLSGNPVAMAAGYATLNYLKRHPECYSRMSDLLKGFSESWKRKSPLTLNHLGSMFTIFFTKNPVTCYSEACSQDFQLFRKTYQAWLKAGIYMPPSMYETAFLSVLHDEKDLSRHLAIR